MPGPEPISVDVKMPVPSNPPDIFSPWRLCVAPMMDWTDRHCRYFHRQLSGHARLYTEMIPIGALVHGDLARHLDFHPDERPVALQLGGSDPAQLAHGARLAERWGYSEVNLNCGCPSQRVQSGSFGACLMAEPALVADCIKAMRDAVSIPVTVKHRIGVDRRDDGAMAAEFVARLHEAGCSVFIVHARSAWLDGLSPRQNREVPPLRYEVVQALKRDFPGATFVLNGGLQGVDDVRRQIAPVDGVMLGRAAYHEPMTLARLEGELFAQPIVPGSIHDVLLAMTGYLERVAGEGVPTRSVARCMLGLYHGRRGARRFRRLLSDPRFLETHGSGSLLEAARSVQGEEGTAEPADLPGLAAKGDGPAVATRD
jgi:tRNA-dihydrouridine synthase A